MHALFLCQIIRTQQKWGTKTNNDQTSLAKEHTYIGIQIECSRLNSKEYT